MVADSPNTFLYLCVCVDSTKTNSKTHTDSKRDAPLNTQQTITQYSTSSNSAWKSKQAYSSCQRQQTLANFCEKQSETNLKEETRRHTFHQRKLLSILVLLTPDISGNIRRCIFLCRFYNDKDTTVCMDYFHSLCIFMCLS